MFLLGSVMSFVVYGEEIVETDNTVVETVYKSVYDNGQTVFSAEAIASVWDVVYVDDIEDQGHFRKIEEAMEHVQEGGIIYIGKDIKVFQPIEITKSLQIKSLDTSKKQFAIQGKMNSVFFLKDIPSFTLENVHVIGFSVNVIGGQVNQIVIQNNVFESCNPLYIDNGSDYQIHMEGNHIIDGKIEVRPVGINNEMDFIDNTLCLKWERSKSVILKNMNVNMHGNTFKDYSLIFRDGEEIQGSIQNNIFHGDTGKIVIEIEGETLHFHRNKILKNFVGAIYTTGGIKIDFTYNWWGSKDGPGGNIPKDKLNCDGWALFEDFRRFDGDPYTIEDLKALCRQWGQDIDENNWIYNVKQDNILDVLDTVGIMRTME